MPNRAALAQAFVAGVGWGDAALLPLAGDASARRYFRLTRPDTSAVLMDAPPGQADSPASFVTIAHHLLGLGLSAPQILAQDLTQGFLLLEDLGDGLFARLIPNDPATEATLYAAATDVLVHLQRHPAPDALPDLAPVAWAEAATLALTCYRFAITGTHADPSAFIATLTTLLARHADQPRVLILRDYHAENLLWLPSRDGQRRVGLLDFQLGQMGQAGYDLVSLLQDARRDVPAPIEAAMTRRFITATGTTVTGFAAAYAVLGAQRALRILGVFARLGVSCGKPGYLRLIPRVWGQLQHNLAHPALAPLAAICQDLLPAPTPARLERIAAQCGTHPSP